MAAQVLIAKDDPAISDVVRDAIAERLGVTAGVVSNGAGVAAPA